MSFDYTLSVYWIVTFFFVCGLRRVSGRSWGVVGKERVIVVYSGVWGGG